MGPSLETGGYSYESRKFVKTFLSLTPRSQLNLKTGFIDRPKNFTLKHRKANAMIEFTSIHDTDSHKLIRNRLKQHLKHLKDQFTVNKHITTRLVWSLALFYSDKFLKKII